MSAKWTGIPMLHPSREAEIMKPVVAVDDGCPSFVFFIIGEADGATATCLLPRLLSGVGIKNYSVESCLVTLLVHQESMHLVHHTNTKFKDGKY